MTNIYDAVEETCAGALSRGACEDSVFERLRFQTAAGAGGLGLGGSPGGMFRQVAFTGSHLVDSSCHELAQTHKGARVNGWGVMIVGRGLSGVWFCNVSFIPCIRRYKVVGILAV